MRVGIDYGLEHLDLEVPEGNLVRVRRQPEAPALADPAAAVREALENPLGFPPLRRALTPDDHVVVVVDEHLPRLPELLVPILEYLVEAHVAPETITLLCPPSASHQEWLDRLPEAFEEVHVEVHDPSNRRQLSYLAATRQGRRIYLNRTVVDADQSIVLTRAGYDPLLGYSGSEGLLYPALSDEATRREACGRLSLDVPGEAPWPLRQEATEVAWLLGAPFLVQVIEGAGEEIVHVVGGLVETAREGQRLLDARWRAVVDRPADVVVAGISGDPAHQDFGDLARALACASRVVKPQGRIALLSRVGPPLGAAAELVRQAEDPAGALALLRDRTPPDLAAAVQWASGVDRAVVYLLGNFPAETTEELFATPLDHAGQVQRLLGTEGSCLILPDAHKTLAVVDA